MKKTCNKCNIEFDISCFYKHPKFADGYNKRCKSCHAKVNKQSYLKNRDKRLDSMKIYRNTNHEKILQGKKNYYQNNKHKCKESSNNWVKNNRDKVSKIHKKWSIKNKDKLLANSRERSLRKINRTPIWLTKEDKLIIREFYKLAKLKTEQTGIKWEVDHIIPLKGKNVSGLHVPNNLQVITKLENNLKRNKFTGIV